MIENPSHSSATGQAHFDSMPKRVAAGKLRLSQSVSDIEGWGLQLSEHVCWTKVFILESVIGALGLLFAICWCRFRQASVQDGFTVAGVIIAYGTIIVGLMQGVAQYCSNG